MLHTNYEYQMADEAHGVGSNAHLVLQLKETMTMTREEFYEWLNTCPDGTYKWELTADEHGFVAVSFPTQEDEEESTQ